MRSLLTTILVKYAMKENYLNNQAPIKFNRMGRKDLRNL